MPVNAMLGQIGHFIESDSASDEMFAAIIFPCLLPVNPHMQSSQARLKTFLDNFSIWPAYRIRATPQQIVDAGMYYLGERDRVKCWYCNGGLQNWERDDDPMEEHAKWFPLCEFVLQQKGPDYVHQIVLRNPGLRRPLIPNPSTAESAEFLREKNISGSHPSSTNPVTIVDPRAVRKDLKDKVNAAMEASELVGRAKMMDFSDYVVRTALMKYV